jgi:hypothetical protein
MVISLAHALPSTTSAVKPLTAGSSLFGCFSAVVARDGIEGHYILPFMPLDGIRLNLRLDLH